MKTKTEKMIELLLKEGCKEIESNSRKYRKFINPRVVDKFYFVGNAGGVRRGRIYTKSISCTEFFSGMLE